MKYIISIPLILSVLQLTQAGPLSVSPIQSKGENEVSTNEASANLQGNDLSQTQTSNNELSSQYYDITDNRYYYVEDPYGDESNDGVDSQASDDSNVSVDNTLSSDANEIMDNSLSSDSNSVIDNSLSSDANGVVDNSHSDDSNDIVDNSLSNESQEETQEPIPNENEDSNQDEDLPSFVGMTLVLKGHENDIVVNGLPESSLPKPYRIITPDTAAITFDYVYNRLNVYLNENNTIVKLTKG